MPVLLLFLLALSTAFGWALATSGPPVVPEADVTNPPIQIPEDGYTSSATCRACHPAQYASWHRSYHRTMTQVASADSVAADFDNVTVADVHGRPMTLTRSGRQFRAAFDDPDW